MSMIEMIDFAARVIVIAVFIRSEYVVYTAVERMERMLVELSQIVILDIKARKYFDARNETDN